MPITVPSRDEYGQGGGDFGLLQSDEYRVRVLDWEEKPNQPNKYNPEGKGVSIWFRLSPIGYADDETAELVDDNGDPIHPDKTLIFFYDPERLGLVPVIARSRKFLAAALNVPVEDHIEFDSYDELVGKEVIVAVTQRNGKNAITDVRPIRTRTRTRVATKKAAVQVAAEEVFGDVEVSEEEEY